METDLFTRFNSEQEKEQCRIGEVSRRELGLTAYEFDDMKRPKENQIGDGLRLNWHSARGKYREFGREYMKGDFSNFRYKPKANYISVLKQQGRLDLDSDWNEQAEILDQRLRGVVRDILGDMAVPLASNDLTRNNSGALKIDDFSSGPGGVLDFSIGRGIAYIGGYPFVLENDATFRAQPDYPEPEIYGSGDDILVYIELWTKTVNYIDDETIREPALGGPDTCLRKKAVGQIKAVFVSNIATPENACEYIRQIDDRDSIQFTLKIEQSAHQIPISFGEVDMDGGLIPGNLHFRIELHRGPAFDGGVNDGFKWSDENAATVMRILKMPSEYSVVIEETEVITGEFLKEGDWVEISNEITELHRQGGQMARVERLEQDVSGSIVTLDTAIHPLLKRFKAGEKSGQKLELSPRLRRWSGYNSPMAMKTVFDLGRGIKAIFHAGKDYLFCPGDFWTFAIRDREYNKKYAPQKADPDGVKTYRHPLAIICNRGSNKPGEIIDCRKFFGPIAAFRS